MKNTPIHYSHLLMVLLVLPAVFSGCAHYQGDGSMTAIVATSEAFNSFDGEYENTDYFIHHKSESIAVLPFSSLDEKVFTLESGVYSQVAVGCEVRMWDLNTGDLLWRSKHVSRAHAGGLSLSIITTLAHMHNRANAQGPFLMPQRQREPMAVTGVCPSRTRHPKS